MHAVGPMSAQAPQSGCKASVLGKVNGDCVSMPFCFLEAALHLPALSTSLCRSGGCFPGDAEVIVRGKGSIPVGQLHLGDEVLSVAGNTFMYDKVVWLGMLHSSLPPRTFMLGHLAV